MPIQAEREAPPTHSQPDLEGGGWSEPRSDSFTPGKEPVSIVQEAGWALKQV
jgi:hypothetical protein